MPERFGPALGRMRAERKLSLRGLGALVHYSHVYLWQVEHGEKPVTSELADRCDRALGGGGELVAIAEEEGVEALRRRPSAAGARPADATSVRTLRSVRENLLAVYRDSGGAVTRPRVLEYLRNHALPLVDGPYEAAIGPELQVAVGSLMALAGICAYDGEDRAAAERHYAGALRLGRAAGDRQFVGYVTALVAHLALRTGEIRRARTECERALVRSDELSAGLATDLLCLRAEVSAASGDAEKAAEQVGPALARVEDIRREAEPPETRHIGPGMMSARWAGLLSGRGEVERAEATARAALVLDRRAGVRAQLDHTIVLVNVLLAAGRVDVAARNARDLTVPAGRLESKLIRGRLAVIATTLGPHRNRDRNADAFCVSTEELLRAPL